MMDSSRGAERAKERRETGIGMRMAGLGFQTSSEVQYYGILEKHDHHMLLKNTITMTIMMSC
jgi:hypothetical protein